MEILFKSNKVIIENILKKTYKQIDRYLHACGVLINIYVITSALLEKIVKIKVIIREDSRKPIKNI